MTYVTMIESFYVGEQDEIKRQREHDLNYPYAQNFIERYRNFVPKQAKSWLRCSYGGIQLPIESGSKALENALDELKKLSCKVYLSEHVFFTAKEEKNIRFFRLYVGEPLELEGKGIWHFGTKAKGGCAECGIGREVDGDILIDRKFMKGYCIGELSPDIFVNAEVKETIEKAGFEGVTFNRKVLDYKGREIEDFFCADVENILPPMSKETWLELVPFRSFRSRIRCEHQYTFLRSFIKYPKSVLDNAADFNRSCEYINNIIFREVIVSARVKEVLQTLNLPKRGRRLVEFHPVIETDEYPL